MPNVTMPNGDVVAFPDDMPKADISAWIEKTFPGTFQDSLMTGARKGLQNVIPGMEQSLAGISQGLGEFVTDAANREAAPPAMTGNLGLDLINAPANAARAAIGLLPDQTRKDLAYQGAVQSLRGQLRAKAAEENMVPVNAPSLSGGSIAATVTQSTAQMLPAIAASVLMRNPTPALAAAGIQSGGQAYRTGRQDQIDWSKNFLDEAGKAGLTPEQARQYAGFYAAAEAIPEMIPLGILLKEGGSLIARVIKTSAAEGVTEGITQTIQSALDKGFVTPDMTWEQAWPQIVQAMAAGTISGAIFGGTAHGIHALRGKEEEPAPEPAPPAPAPPVGTPIEDQQALPAPQTLLALPSPEQFKEPVIARRQPQLQQEDVQPSIAQIQEERDYQARVALQKTRQAETSALLQTARETITPLGTFTPEEIGDDAAGRVRERRVRLGRPVEAPVTVDELAAAKVPQKQIDAVIAARRPQTAGQVFTPLDIVRSANSKNIIANDSNFTELAYRTTGQRNVQRMTQAQLGALKSVIDAMPAHESPVTVPVAESPSFTEEHFNKALDAIRKDGRYTARAIKEATGLKSNSDVAAIREAMVRRGQLVQRGKNDFRLYDVVGQERQTTPTDLPPGAFSEYVTRQIPVQKVRIRQDGNSVGTFSSATEARSRVRDIRAAEDQAGQKASSIAIEPAGDVAWGVMENRYDEAGNLLGQAVVSTHKTAEEAQAEAGRMGSPDTGARYTQTVVQNVQNVQNVKTKPVREIVPAALEGRLPEIVKRLNQQARDRRLPLLGVRVQLKSKIVGPESEGVAGLYLRKLIQLSAQNLTADMTTDEIVEGLAGVMDHETIHALREAGVLSPETDGWKAIVRYARRAKRGGSKESYTEWAKRIYTGVPGYETVDAIEEEAIAEAFRAWAANRRNVVGQPATVFRQIVEWFKRLISALPEDVFRAIESGSLVEAILRPPGSNQPRAKATATMQEAAQGVSAAQAAQDENLVRVRSREYLRARAQAREDRYGRSGPKTVLGTTPSKAYETGEIANRDQVEAIVGRFKSANGVTASPLRTYLPIDPEYMKRVADAQQTAVHDPGNDAVAKAYRALINETKAMWWALGDIEVTPWTGDGQPYASPEAMMEDIDAGRLTMRLSDDLFGPGADNPGHPMNAASGVKTTDGRDLSNNDLFRVVHDIYGHGQSGFRDTPQGAYNAYHEHARLVSRQALPALATETLAQRAWQDYGPHLRRKDGTVPRETDVDYLPPAQKEFAQQKAFLLDPKLIEADPGWERAARADGVEDSLPKYSLAPPVDTPEFRNWFGGSKVVDAEGKPLVVYHGAEAKRTEFKKKKGTRYTLGMPYEVETPAFFFSPDKGFAKSFGDKTTSVYLRAEKPLDLTEGAWGQPDEAALRILKDQFGEQVGFVKPEELWELLDDSHSVEQLRALGYDAVTLRERGNDGELHDVYAVFDPTQIKSVYNRGTFDPNDARIRYSKFSDDLPGGRLYGNPKRSPGGALSKPGTPTPAFTSDRPGNQWFGGELAEEQLRMARDGVDGTTIIYLPPESFLALANQEPNPEQEIYNIAVSQGYKLSGMPSLVTDGYAGNVRVVGSDGTAGVRALASVAEPIPVVLYPKKPEGLGLVTALEANGTRIPWPHEGRAENFPERRLVNLPAFKRWFGDSKVVDAEGKPLVVYHHGSFDEATDVPSGAMHFGTKAAAEERSHGKRVDDAAMQVTAYQNDAGEWHWDDGTGYTSEDAGHDGGYSSEDTAIISGRSEVVGQFENDDFAPEDSGVITEAYLSLKNPKYMGDQGSDWTAAIEQAKAEGHDGIVYRNLFEDKGQRSYIAFDPTQIKSVYNVGTFDPNDERIRYSLTSPYGTRLPTTPPGPMFNIVQQRIDGAVGRFIKNIGRSKRSIGPLPSIYDLRVKLQDKMLSWKELNEYAAEHGGLIDDINNVYMLEQLYHGKVFDQIAEREERLQKPLLAALKEAYDGPKKITPKDFEDYLYARHAPERNAYLRTRGAPDPDPSGMSDAEARTILDTFALDGKLPILDTLGALADRITADTTQTRVDYGLISQEAAGGSPYQYYVPLRGFAEEALDPGDPEEQATRARSGRGFSIGGREDRTVTGRERKAGDLLGHLFLQNTEAVIRGHKNEVALAAMRFIQDNRSLGVGSILATAPTRRVVGANGMIHEAGDPTYRQQPDIITAKWKGKEVVARLVDPRLARAIKSDYITSSNMFINALGLMNRYLAMINTSMNPEFLISNLARDMQTAGLLSAQYDIKGFGRKIIGNAPKAMGGIREVLRKGTANGPWAALFKELQEAGGTTEFLGIHDLETQINRIRRSITQTGWRTTPRKAMGYLGEVFKFVNDYNKVAENAFRLSAYKAARDAGVSIPQAAYLAKNLTVNFNKGGEQKALMNSLYLFYNAGLQGSVVLANGLKSKRVRRLVAGVTVAGILQDVLNRALSGDDDDNGVTDYDDIPDYVLEHNFVLMDPLGLLEAVGIKQGYFALPMPYGFNAFYNLGRNMSAAISGSPMQSPGKAAANAALGFLDAFNPLGGAQSLWNFLSPTFLDPAVDLWTNKDFSGKKIVPDRFDQPGGIPVPDSQKYWSTTGDIPKDIASWLNAVTGGNEVRKGAIDWSPETLQYAYDFAFGSAGKFAERIGKMAAGTPDVLRGDFSNVDIGEIPFARRVVGSIGKRGNTERYYNTASEVFTVRNEIRMYAESGKPDLARRIIASKPLEASFIPMFESADKALQDMREQLRNLRDNPNIPADRRREMEKRIKDAMDRLMAQVNRTYFEKKKLAVQ